MVCLSNKGENILVEIELELKNFLNHNHPIETVDYIVCWNVNLEENRIYKMNNKSCIFVNSKERKYLMFDEKELEVIELKSIIKQIKESKQNIFNYIFNYLYIIFNYLYFVNQKLIKSNRYRNSHKNYSHNYFWNMVNSLLLMEFN